MIKRMMIAILLAFSFGMEAMRAVPNSPEMQNAKRVDYRVKGMLLGGLAGATAATLLVTQPSVSSVAGIGASLIAGGYAGCRLGGVVAGSSIADEWRGTKKDMSSLWERACNLPQYLKEDVRAAAVFASEGLRVVGEGAASLANNIKENRSGIKPFTINLGFYKFHIAQNPFQGIYGKLDGWLNRRSKVVFCHP